MINEKGIELFSEDQAEIERIWEKLESKRAKGLKVPKNLAKELVEGHSFPGKPLSEEHLDFSENFEQPARNPFENEDFSAEHFEYDDPFVEGDDQEVEIINFDPHDSREFSLSRYDVSIKKFETYTPPQINGQKTNGCFEHEVVSTPSEELDDIQEEDEEESIHSEETSPELAEVSKAVSNQLYFRQREVSRGSEDGGSGHVICDCEDCINQTDVVDCQCENCVHQREVTLNPAQRLREVTCDCEECLIRQNEPEYLCHCEQCELNTGRKPKSKEISRQDDHCRCAECVQINRLVFERDSCQCEKCIQSESSSSDFRGHRSPPQGSSQEYQNFEHDIGYEGQSQNSHSDRSFESDTEKSVKSVRSSRSKGSNCDTERSFKSKGSNSEILSEKVGSIHYNGESDDEYIKERNLVSLDGYLHVKHGSKNNCDPYKHSHRDIFMDNTDGTYSTENIATVENQNCEREPCLNVPPEKHTVSVQPIKPNISR